MKLALLAVLAALAFPAATDVPFKTVVKGSGMSSSVTKRDGRVVRDQASWKRLRARLGVDGSAPRIDFSRHMLVAVVQGRRSTGGYSVAVTRIRRSGDRLTVHTCASAGPAGAASSPRR